MLIDGVDIAKMSDAELREVRRKKIAMVFQSFALMPHMSVLDNTAFGMALAGVPAAEREQKSPGGAASGGAGELCPRLGRMNSPAACASASV